MVVFSTRARVDAETATTGQLGDLQHCLRIWASKQKYRVGK